jgi:hypothetical protein
MIIDGRKSIRPWNAAGRTAKEFCQLIVGVEHLLKKEEHTGHGRLGKKIDVITSANQFYDFPIVFLPARGEAIIIGDTHGDSLATQAIIKQERVIEKIEQGQEVYVIFLGDYADRGLADIKNLELVLSLVQRYHHHVILLRGNHEETTVGQYYGLFGSCIKQFGFDDGQQVFKDLNDLFEKFPSLVVAGNGLVAVHGGVPATPIYSLHDLQDEENSTELRWNDPTEEIDHYVHNYKRGTYFLFGKIVFDAFMSAIGGNVLVRSHEYVSKGSKLLFGDRLLTIFSNGGKSAESGYRDFILSPKYAKIDLSKKILKWSKENVIPIQY